MNKTLKTFFLSLIFCSLSVGIVVAQVGSQLPDFLQSFCGNSRGAGWVAA
jgi:hypothetical protein